MSDKPIMGVCNPAVGGEVAAKVRATIAKAGEPTCTDRHHVFPASSATSRTKTPCRCGAFEVDAVGMTRRG